MDVDYMLACGIVWRKTAGQRAARRNFGMSVGSPIRFSDCHNGVFKIDQDGDHGH